MVSPHYPYCTIQGKISSYFVKSWVLDEVMMFMTLISRMRVDSLAENIEEVSKEPLVHVPGHLVENKPVTQGAMLYIVLYMAVILILLEISSDLPLYQEIPAKVFKLTKQ